MMQPGISGCAVAPDWGAHAPRLLAIGPTRSRTFLRQNVSRRRNQHAGARALPARDRAFTLIELLVVITIIVILMGLLFPVFRGVQDQAKKTQAKNDLTQIVTAVNAFYTEYGNYPLVTAETIYGAGNTSNDALFSVLRGINAAENPRQIVFLSPPDVKNGDNPRSGIATKNATVGSIAVKTGEFVDPWGTPYLIEVDGDYSGDVANPYSSNAGSASQRSGVIAWSLGKDQVGAKTAAAGDKKTGVYDDDVISWQ
jgi:prepilin-type N-terminal cleavage/methylation domain-containing protein